MADEAFALSPISARAAMPGEADYDAIFAAVMETVRGRWFLAEYAKRNRNADTELILAAIGRVETLWHERQPVAAADPARHDLTDMADAIARARADIAAPWRSQRLYP